MVRPYAHTRRTYTERGQEKPRNSQYAQKHGATQGLSRSAHNKSKRRLSRSCNRNEKYDNFAENQRKAIYNKEAQEEYETILATNNEKRQEEIKTAQNTIQDKEQLEEAIKEINSKYDDLNQKTYDSYDFGYAIDVHQQTVDAITAQMNSGMELAEETKKLLLNMSEEQRQNIYATAENQRQQSEQNAEIERQRGVVDARSSYEQNKASYGANAESMGKMGLSGSGYGDYLTSKAYAQQRAETQNANARSETAKREARYIENQAKLDADSAHNQNKYNAERDYAQQKYEIDTSYRNNLLNADTDKLQRDHDAEAAERESKFQADQTHSQNLYNAASQKATSNHEAESTARENNLANDTTYKTNLFEADSQARADALTAQQETDAGKFAADLSYRENMLNNDDDIGAYRQQKEEEEKAKAEQHESDYYSFYDIAKSGNYSTEEIRELATKKGFSEEEIAALETIAGESISKSQAANNAQFADKMGDTVGSILSLIQSEKLSSADGVAQIRKLIADKIVDISEIDSLYNDGRISEEMYQQIKNGLNPSGNNSSGTPFPNPTELPSATDPNTVISNSSNSSNSPFVLDSNGQPIVLDSNGKPVVLPTPQNMWNQATGNNRTFLNGISNLNNWLENALTK